MNASNKVLMDKKKIQNCAYNLLCVKGFNIRKNDVRVAVSLNKLTSNLRQTEREIIINRIWRRIKWLIKTEALKKEERDDS
jgi:hypothetical protein